MLCRQGSKAKRRRWRREGRENPLLEEKKREEKVSSTFPLLSLGLRLVRGGFSFHLFLSDRVPLPIGASEWVGSEQTMGIEGGGGDVSLKPQGASSPTAFFSIRLAGFFRCLRAGRGGGEIESKDKERGKWRRKREGLRCAQNGKASSYFSPFLPLFRTDV